MNPDLPTHPLARDPHHTANWVNAFKAALDSATKFDDDSDLRMWATAMLVEHFPSAQGDNAYDRCERCHYTRHPCDVFDGAAAIIRLLDEKAGGWLRLRQPQDNAERLYAVLEDCPVDALVTTGHVEELAAWLDSRGVTAPPDKKAERLR